MRSKSATRLLLAASVCLLTIDAAAVSYDIPNRQELKRADLSGAPGMEVITSITEYQVGEVIPRHTHHGLETGYVFQGSMIQGPRPWAAQAAHGSHHRQGQAAVRLGELMRKFPGRASAGADLTEIAAASA